MLAHIGKIAGTMGAGWRRFSEKVVPVCQPCPFKPERGHSLALVSCRASIAKHNLAGYLRASTTPFAASRNSVFVILLCLSDHSRIAGVQTKQDWHLTLNNSFDATKNTRNTAMLADAAEFAKHLRLCEREIQNIKAATEGMVWLAASFRHLCCCQAINKLAEA